MRRKSNPSALLRECRLVRPLWQTIWNFLRKLKMELSFDSAIPMLGLYPNNPDTWIQKSLCTPMFIAAQFTIAKYWKQPKCPSATSGSKNCGIFKQWNLTQQSEKGAYTLCNSMDGTGEHYSKWNKPGGEGPIPYDLTFNWNIINRKKRKQNITRDNEVKNSLTIASGEWLGDSGKRGLQELL